MTDPSPASQSPAVRAASEPAPTVASRGPASAEGSYRLSDAERTAAVAELSDAFAEGRLDAEEFEARMSVASQAKLSHELDPLFADLPGPHAVRAASATTRASARRPEPYPARPSVRGVAGPPWAASGYPAQCAPRHVGHRNRRPAQQHPGPIAFLPFVVLMLIGTSAAFLIPFAIMALVLLAHVVPGAHRRR